MSSSESEVKDKKRKRVDDDPALLAPIATPLADKKLTKKLLSLVKQTIEAKELKRGVKQCVKFIRKEEADTKKQRMAILGGDVSPIDVVAHIPVMCEDRDIPYIYISSRQKLGQAAGTKRPTSIVLVTITDSSTNKKLFKKCKEAVKEVQPIKT